MPSASSSRFQSRLFNFVHQQTRRLGEQCERTFRHLKVATSWTLQALLYPLFSLFEKVASSAGKQLRAKQQKPTPQLQSNHTDKKPEIPPRADTPIQQVLQAVEVFASETEDTEKPSSSSFLASFAPSVRDAARWRFKFLPKPQTPAASLKRHLPSVRGIATQISNRNLVLVSGENEILDILTPQQQEKLQNEIIAQVAKYWHSRRLLNEVKDETILLGEIDRLLTKLTGGKADKIPALPQATTKAEISSSKSLSKTLLDNKRPLALLDKVVASLEANALVPMSRTSSQLLQVAQTGLNTFLYGKELAVTTDAQTHTFKIHSLIWAAINYFFGDRTNKKIQSTTQSKSVSQLPINPSGQTQHPFPALPKSENFHSPNLADPWLTESDLFGVAAENQQKLVSTTTNSSLPPSRTSKFSLQNLISRFPVPIPGKTKPSTLALLFSTLGCAVFMRGALYETPKGRVRQSPLLTELREQVGKPAHGARLTTTPVRETPSLLKSQSINEKISQQQTTQVEAQPDWIETQATTIGYEKHPLERILQWLDQIMLLLEEIFANIFQFLRGLWGGKE